jgi:hypothetical protein
MREDGDQGAVYIAVAHTDRKGGANLLRHAEIESHASPRHGVIFIDFKVAQALIGSQGCFHVVQRTGIERYRPAQNLHRKKPPFRFGQSFEGFQQLGSLLAHNP